MAELVYIMCAVMSSLCAFMLLRNFKGARSALLLWSGLCFAGLALNNIILVIDIVILPDIDFGGPLIRYVLTSLSGTLLLVGLIWELV